MRLDGIPFLFVLFISCLVFAKDIANEEGEVKLDGTVWTRAALDERVGILYAMDDCLTFDASPQLLFDGKWADYERKVSSAYQSGKVPQSTLVVDVFRKFGKNVGHDSLPKNSERYGDEFWRSHNDPARRGFIEGFISCEKSLGREVLFGASIQTYVQRLNDLYNADDRNGETAPEYAGSASSAIEQVRREMVK